MNQLKVCLLTAVVAVGLVMPVSAQQQDRQAASPPLVQLLQSKGILSPDEATQISHASTPEEANARLAQMLMSKGLISQDDYERSVATTENVSDTGSGGHLLHAVVRTPSNNPSLPAPATSDMFTYGAPAEGESFRRWLRFGCFRLMPRAPAEGLATSNSAAAPC